MAELGRVGREAADDSVAFISAKTGQGVDLMVEKLERIITEGKRRVEFNIPNSDAGALNTLYRLATVESVDYGYDGMKVVALVDNKVLGMLKKYAPASETGESEEY
jgi:50S ribosomal subunit-associated GTPase HflX